jgi:phosphatidylserine decarboxylase precursor-related protein
MDVHWQYFPFDGTVVNVEHDMNGQFELSHDLDKSDGNEKIIHTLQSSGPCPVQVKVVQIAGMITRRITYTHEPGSSFTAGDKLGVIHLGSRADVHIPPNAEFAPELSVGQKIKAGNIIAYTL